MPGKSFMPVIARLRNGSRFISWSWAWVPARARKSGRNAGHVVGAVGLLDAPARAAPARAGGLGVDFFGRQRLKPQIVLPRLAQKQIDQTGVAVHHKVQVAVAAKSVRVGRDVHGLGPRLVGRAEPPIPVFLLHGVCQHIEGAGVPELLDHLGYGVPAQPVVPVVFGNGILNGLLAGDVGAAGRPVQIQVSLFAGIGGVVPVERQLPLGVQRRFGLFLDAVPDHVHVGSLPVGKFFVNIRQRGRRGQQRSRLGFRQLQSSIAITMSSRRCIRRRGSKPPPGAGFSASPEFVLLGGHLFIEGRVFVCVHVIAPPRGSCFFVRRSRRHGTAKPLQDGGARTFGNNRFRGRTAFAVDIQQRVQFHQPGGFHPQIVLIGERLAYFLFGGGLLLVEIVQLVLDRLQPLGHLRQRIVDTGQVAARICSETCRWVILPFSRSVYSCRNASKDADIAKPR